MRNFKEYIIEKLKVSKNIKAGPTLRDFLDFYMRNSNWEWKDLHQIMFGYDMWGKDKEFKNWEEFKNFLEYNIDKHITVELNRTDSKSVGWTMSTNQPINQYTFEVDNVPFVVNINKYVRKDTFEDWFRTHHPDEVYEKLKVSNKSSNMLQVELRNFITWYMYDDDEWDEDELKFVEFARNTTDKYFDGSYKKLYEFICKHEQDVIYVSEEYKKAGIYMYSFEVDGIPFEIQASIDKESELLSAQSNILIEKLKVTTDSIKGSIKSTMKGFFLWYWNYETINDDFWDSMESVEFANDVIEDNFNNMNEFLDWFSKNMDDIVYFEEVKDGKENYRYTFSCDGMEFVIDAWISPENGIYLFSKSQYIIKRLHEKLKVSKPKVINCTVKQLFKKEFDRKFNYNDLIGFFEKVRKEHFDNNVYDMIAFLQKHANDKIEVTQEIEDIIDGFGEVVKYSFTLDGIEFSDIIVVEYVTEKLKVSSNVKPETIDCTVKQFMDWFWRDKDSKYTGEDLEIFQFGGDAILQISPSRKDYDKMYVFLKWREDEDIEVTEQIESGRSHKLDTDWQYGIYTFTLGGVTFDVTAPFSSDEDPFSVYYEKLMEIEL